MTSRPPPQLLDHISRVFPTFLHIIDILPRVGIVPPSELDCDASVGGEEGLEKDEDDRVVRVVVDHLGLLAGVDIEIKVVGWGTELLDDKVRISRQLTVDREIIIRICKQT